MGQAGQADREECCSLGSGTRLMRGKYMLIRGGAPRIYIRTETDSGQCYNGTRTQLGPLRYFGSEPDME